MASNKQIIYEPSDDSYLLQKTLEKFLEKNNKNIKILDLGSGSGIQALTCRELGFNKILVSDVNKESIKELKKLGFKAVKSNLFSNIKGKFDLIIFNPPYLPEDKLEPLDSKINTTAGKKGYEIIVKFLIQAKKHLTNKGVILLLFSSFSRPKIILREAKEFGYSYDLLDRKKLFFEELYVFEFKLKDMLCCMINAT